MCGCLQIEWRSDGLYFKSKCCDWKKVAGIPPAALNPDPTGEIPPDDPYNEIPPSNDVACFKASAMAELAMSWIKAIFDAYENDIPILATEFGYFEDKYGKSLETRYWDRVKYFNEFRDDWENAREHFEGDGIEDQIKQDFQCALLENISKENTLTTADITLVRAYEFDTGHGSLDNMLERGLDILEDKTLQQRAIGAIASQRGDCAPCNPAPVDPNTVPPEPGCYRLDFERFAAPLIPSAGTGEEPSSTFTASEKGTQYAFGSYQGVYDAGQDIHWGAVILNFNEPVTLNGLRFLLEWVSNDGGDIFTGIRIRRSSDQMYVNVQQGYENVGSQPVIVAPGAIPGVSGGTIDRIYISGLAFNNANFRISNVVVTFTANSVVHQNVPLGLVVCNP